MGRGLGPGKLRKVDGYWQADYTDAHGKRVRRNFGRSKIDAQTRLTKVIRERDLALAGLSVPDRSIGKRLWNDEAALFLEEVGRDLSPNTVSNYTSHLQAFSRTMHVLRIEEATSEVIEAYRALRMKGGLSRSSANASLVGLRAFFSWIKKTYGKKWPSPTDAVERLEVKSKDLRRPRRALTDDELSLLLDTADDLYGKHDPKVCFLWTLAQTGGRRAETALLTWDDIDLDEGRIHFRADRAKQGEPRTVPMEPELLERLKAYRATLSDRAVLAFPNRARSKDYSVTRAFTDWLRGLLKSADIERVTDDGVIDTHALRHTYCTRLIRAGMSVSMVAKLSGHRNHQTLNAIYSHLKLEDVEVVAVEALSGFRQKTGKKAGVEPEE